MPDAASRVVDASEPLTIAEHFAEYAAGLTFDALPPRAVQLAELLVIDAVACGLAAVGTDLHTTAGRWLAGAAPGAARAFGHRAGVAAEPAVMMNGALIHALDFDDIPHFGAVEIPPAMAVAQERAISGAHLITSIVAGFEIGARVTATLAHGRAQHPIGLVGPIGSAVVASTLLGLDRRAIASAICIAASTGAGLTQNFGTFTKPLHAGRAAEAGLVAARLAASGWTADLGALEGPKGFFTAYGDPLLEPATAVTGDEAFWIARLPADLAAGSRFDPDAWPLADSGRGPDISLVGRGAPSDRRRGGPNLRRGPSFKPWPACGGNNAVLTAAFEALLVADVDRDEIDRIEIVVPFDPNSGALFRTEDPRDGLQGKFSLRYGVAAAWRDGTVGVDSYRDEHYDRLMSEGWFDRVSCRTDPDYIDSAVAPQPQDPDCSWAAVVLHLRSGATRTGWAYNRGLELSAAAVHAKFRHFAGAVIGDDEASALLADLTHLDRHGDIGPVLDRCLG